MEIQNLFDKARQLIEDSKNPIMFIDTDTDGSMSYVQLKRTFPQIDFAYPIKYDQEDQLKGVAQIEDKHDLIIIFDKGRLEDDFFTAANGRPILWCDHHVPPSEEFRNSHPNLTYVNPMIIDFDDERCSAYLAYRIAKDESNLFYATMASVADAYILDVLIDLYEKDPKRFNLLFKISDEKREELFEFIRTTSFTDKLIQQERMKWVSFLSYDCGMIRFKTFFDTLYKLQKPNESIGTLRKIVKMTPEEFKLELGEGKSVPFDTFKEAMDEYQKLFDSIKIKPNSKLIQVEHGGTSFSFNRQLAEQLAATNENWSVVFCSYIDDEKDFVSCSFRGNDYDVVELINKAREGLDGNGGGHIFSAGAIIMKKDYDEFKKRVKEIVG